MGLPQDGFRDVEDLILVISFALLVGPTLQSPDFLTQRHLHLLQHGDLPVVHLEPLQVINELAKSSLVVWLESAQLEAQQEHDLRFHV